MEFNLAVKKILNQYHDSKIIGAFKIKDGYLFSLKPKSWKDDEYVLDGFFKVTDKEGITEYSPVMDPAEFKEAMKNRIIPNKH